MGLSELAPRPKQAVECALWPSFQKPNHRIMEPSEYRKPIEVRWASLDPNRHVRSTAYADYASDVRFAWPVDRGFPLGKFEERGFGPVLLKEDSRFLRGVTLGVAQQGSARPPCEEAL
jgi:acyl-CoA thioesterase FadM